ncbi:MAG: glycosyltransferase family 39 protein [Thermoleophilia bacterium]
MFDLMIGPVHEVWSSQPEHVEEHATAHLPGERSWDAHDLIIAAALFLLTLLSRLPFMTTMLYAWDSVLYARAIDHFDVLAQQPQPPGYIFYVGLISLFNYIVADKNAAIVWVSVLSSAAAAACLYWLGQAMFSRRVGLLASLFLVTSLSYWAHSEVALPYALLGFLSILVATVVYQTWEGNAGYLIPAAAVLGLASGFRQDLLIFLLPLFAVGLSGKPLSRIFLSLSVLSGTVLCWYVPTVLLSGGLDVYQTALSQQSDYLMRNATFLSGDGVGSIVGNLGAMAHFFFWAASGALPLAGMLVYRLVFRWDVCKGDRRLLFLAVWALPSMLFYIFIHVGELGYIFSFLPAFLLAGVAAADGLLSKRIVRPEHVRGLPLFAYAPALLIAFNLVMFLFISPKLSASSLAARDETLRFEISAIRENFKPDSTMIVAVHDDRQVSYYLPEYRHIRLDPMIKENVTEPLPADIKQVVIFDKYLESSREGTGKILSITPDRYLSYIPREPRQKSVALDWRDKSVTLLSEVN